MGLFIYFTAYKVSKYDVSSGPYFPVFELNTQIYENKFSSNTGKNEPEKNSLFGHFSRSVYLLIY